MSSYRDRSKSPRRSDSWSKQWKHDDHWEAQEWQTQTQWEKEQRWHRSSSHSWESPPTPPKAVLPIALTPRTSFPRRSPTKESWVQEELFNPEVFPREFKADNLYLDSNLKLGLPLPRQVLPTEWSMRKSISNTCIQDVKLVNILYGGWNNWCLRHLAMGRSSFFVMAKSFDKSCLLYSINAALKDTSIDTLAERWNSEQRHPLPHNSDAERKDLLQKYGEFIGQSIMKGMGDSSLFERVQELEKELAQQKQLLANSVKKGSNSGACGKFACSNCSVLHNLVLANVTAKDITAWINKHLTKTQAKTIPKMINELKDLIAKNVAEVVAQQEAVRLALVDYGMPVTMAGKIDKEPALKLLAALHIKESD